MDSDFDHMDYIYKISANDSPIDIEQIMLFYQQLKISANDIRGSVSHLSWKKQMQTVVDSL